MSEVTIVALPEEREEVWELSSQKKPHLTLLYLGDVDMGNHEEIIRFVQHAAATSLSQFGLSVEDRGTLGPEDADVLFFKSGHDNHNIKELLAFRAHLITNSTIAKAYQSVHQYPIWVPHLTMGYPATPAKESTNRYGLSWVNFDRIAVWVDDWEGPEFKLDGQDFDSVPVSDAAWSDDDGVYLCHYGRLGMRWGVRRRTGSDGLVKGSVATAIKEGQKPKAKGAEDIIKSGKKGSKDHKQVQKNLKKRIEDLSTAEIKEVTARIEAVNKFKAVTAAEKAKQKSGAAKIANWAISNVATGGKKATGKYIQDLSEGLVKSVLPDVSSLIPNSKTAGAKPKVKPQQPKQETKPDEPDSPSSSDSSSSTSRDVAIRDLAEAIVGPDGAYDVTTKKGG